MAFSEETIQQVWEKATPVAGNDPAVWRQDQCKAWIGRRFYGNRNSEYGWEIEGQRNNLRDFIFKHII